MHEINFIFKSFSSQNKHFKWHVPHFHRIRPVRPISHECLSTYRCIVIVAVMIGTLSGCASTSSTYDQCAKTDSERVRYLTATLALENGDERLGVQILQELAEDTANDRTLSLYKALEARTEGNLDRVDEILREIPPPSPEEPWGEDAWIETPLAMLMAERELDRFRLENGERLSQILSKHYEARGGLEKLLAITDMLALGRLMGGSQELPFQLARKRNRLYRFDLEMPGGLRVEAFDSDVAWGYDGPGGDTEASYLSGSRLAELERLSFFDDVLVRFERTGEKLFLKNTLILDGQEFYPIDVSEDGKLVETIYLDGETFLEGRRLVWDAHGSLLAERLYEYKTFEGISLPTQQTIRIGTSTVTYHYDEYALDVDIPVRVFVLSEFNEGLVEGP